MTAMDYDPALAGTTEARSRFSIKQRVGALLAALSKRHERNRAYEELSRLDRHLLIDMGINPDDIRDAFENRWSSALFEPIRMPYDKR